MDKTGLTRSKSLRETFRVLRSVSPSPNPPRASTDSGRSTRRRASSSVARSSPSPAPSEAHSLPSSSSGGGGETFLPAWDRTVEVLVKATRSPESVLATTAAEDDADEERAWPLRLALMAGELLDDARDACAYFVAVADAVQSTAKSDDDAAPLLSRLPADVRFRVWVFLLLDGGSAARFGLASPKNVPDAVATLRHMPAIVLSPPAFLRPVWDPAQFQTLRDSLGMVSSSDSTGPYGGIGGALLACPQMRREVLAALLMTRRFHVVISPYATDAARPLATRWLRRYGSRIRRLTVEVDCSRQGFAAPRAALGMLVAAEKGVRKVEGMLTDLVKALVFRRPKEFKLQSLAVLCRRHAGNRPTPTHSEWGNLSDFGDDENEDDWDSDKTVGEEESPAGSCKTRKHWSYCDPSLETVDEHTEAASEPGSGGSDSGIQSVPPYVDDLGALRPVSPTFPSSDAPAIAYFPPTFFANIAAPFVQPVDGKGVMHPASSRGGAPLLRDRVVALALAGFDIATTQKMARALFSKLAGAITDGHVKAADVTVLRRAGLGTVWPMPTPREQQILQEMEWQMKWAGGMAGPHGDAKPGVTQDNKQKGNAVTIDDSGGQDITKPHATVLSDAVAQQLLDKLKDLELEVQHGNEVPSRIKREISGLQSVFNFTTAANVQAIDQIAPASPQRVHAPHDEQPRATWTPAARDGATTPQNQRRKQNRLSSLLSTRELAGPLRGSVGDALLRDVKTGFRRLSVLLGRGERPGLEAESAEGDVRTPQQERPPVARDALQSAWYWLGPAEGLGIWPLENVKRRGAGGGCGDGDGVDKTVAATDDEGKYYLAKSGQLKYAYDDPAMNSKLVQRRDVEVAEGGRWCEFSLFEQRGV